MFDARLAERAVGAGARILCGTRVRSIDCGADFVSVDTSVGSRCVPERAYWRAAPDTHFIDNWPSIHPRCSFTRRRRNWRPSALAT